MSIFKKTCFFPVTVVSQSSEVAFFLLLGHYAQCAERILNEIAQPLTETFTGLIKVFKQQVKWNTSV